ncbi:3-alpha,7-alpha,12-alpha-trihydroxy-5-beta-cholest-24-enoyl-CoA hydratase [Ramlibacter sp. G-1-2-2]|uniref:3-alpha,7-alpha, 12-alpha-trihydroxy-5-beta-cholest-24-enoyl-CoA hydratase n=1 Tax=Ramlibacter agri TaxID=2728837 RepID=A0A848H6P2_9BURK|nr:MaoC/PaaZ C-terminal domain-containing protein [Ramlibacter agri]NML43358.1 3-alpha,7-alpha,12-alpha-trihydroxy-5-beta-cholest-24-enoyl-CoA hydratase [Ramlibacter agri]
MDPHAVRNWDFPVLRQAWTEQDAILYALALGYGSDPVDEAQLRYVYEPGLRVVPTFANVLCHPGFWVSDPRTGIDATKVVHGEQRVQFHAPLPARGAVRSETRVLDVVDKGEGKGALLVFERKLFDEASGALLATIEQHSLCRGDGGFSGTPVAASARGAAAPQETRAPDAVVELQVLPQAALLYRLSADRNPLHADPQVARAAGFPRPILHGLCTFGIACRALLQACAGEEPARLKSLAGRFSAPVYPGELLRTEIWQEGADLRFRCLVPAREAVVFSNGTATLN